MEGPVILSWKVSSVIVLWVTGIGSVSREWIRKMLLRLQSSLEIPIYDLQIQKLSKGMGFYISYQNFSYFLQSKLEKGIFFSLEPNPS